MKSLVYMKLRVIIVTTFFIHEKSYKKLCLALFALILCIVVSTAHAKTAFDGTTPLALAPSSPAGSYTLTDFENINLYNGNLNVNLPLLQIGGRGSVGYTMTSVINDNRWIVEPVSAGFGFVRNVPNYGWWGTLREDYSPGIMQGRGAADSCEEGTSQTSLLTRLTFASADGTETEFIDTAYNGVALWTSCTNRPGGIFNRGKTFVSTDGSFATFISDTDIWDYYIPIRNFAPSGYLLLKDGTRYRIGNGVVEWMQDRNGNRITFIRAFISTPEGQRFRLTITDSTNRQVTVTYDLTNATPNTVYDKIEWKGTNGETRQILVVQNRLW